MDIKPFGVEKWMDRWENNCELNLAETCVDSLRLDELLAFSGQPDAILERMRGLKLTYGAIEGSDALRDQIASLFTTKTRDNVTVTHGAAGANALVYETLVRPGDHIVSFVPAYQQHYSIPESYGATIRYLRLQEADGYLPDLDALRSLVTSQTRMIVFSNPNNPVGSLMDRAMLEAVVEIARSVGAWILSDEVYRGIDQEGDGFTVSVADLYAKGISTGSMSKAYSLAGLRLGWIVGPAAFMHDVTLHRHYNTISVGMIDDMLATLALEHRGSILKRNRELLRGNLAILDAWVAAERGLSYVKPSSGTTALVKYAHDIPSHELCVQLIERTGVMFTPGSAMEMEGHVRVGYANARRNLELGLPRVSAFLRALPHS
jgi:aspartate/methionine/tyrosine aminotransferase